jgi:hypothetical protein
VLGRDVPDELLDKHCLPHARSAKEPHLAALKKRDDEINRFDSGLKYFSFGCLFVKGGRSTVDRESGHGRVERALPVDRLAKHVKKPPQRRFADRNRDGRTGRVHLLTAREPRCLIHGNRPDPIEAQMRSHFKHEASVYRVLLDDERVADSRTLP